MFMQFSVHQACACVLEAAATYVFLSRPVMVENASALCMQPVDLRDMARCCKNLGHFGAESSAVKGYIAMMPLFQQAVDTVGHPRWLPGSSQIDKRSYQLQKSLKELIEAVSTWQVCAQRPRYSISELCLSPCVFFACLNSGSK